MAEISNTNNRYNIIIKLKDLNQNLFQSKIFDDVEKCRLELLAYIEEIPILKMICHEIETKQKRFKSDTNYQNLINNTYSYIVTWSNTHAHYQNIEIQRNKIYKFDQLEQVSITEPNKISYSFIEIPSLLFCPSLSSLLSPETNYLHYVLNKQPNIGLGDLYQLFDTNLQLMFSLLSSNYAFEYNFLKQNILNLELQKNNFTTAFLCCVVCSVNNLLQYKLNQENSNFELNNINKENSYSNILKKLSPAECSIINLLKEKSYTMQQIADILVKDYDTIKTQFGSIKNKTGLGKLDLENVIRNN